MNYRLLVALAVALPIVACGSEKEEPKANCPTPSANVSFEKEVLPVFRRSCGLSSVCHGAPTGSSGELYLGPKCPLAKDDPTCMQGAPDMAGRDAIITGFVGRPSKTAAAMNVVTAGDASQSFLMHKMDNTQNDQGLACIQLPNADTPAPCGDSMPQGGDLLCGGERDIVRGWINQGALNN
jgi:hypothetical protein